jgi:hypothetical protein
MPNLAYIKYCTDYYPVNPKNLDINRIRWSYEEAIKYSNDTIFSFCYSEKYTSNDGTTIYSHIGNTTLCEMTKEANISKYINGIGEIIPILTLEKDTEIELTNIYKFGQDVVEKEWGWIGGKNGYINICSDQVLFTVISGPHKGTCFTSDMNSIYGRVDTAHFEDLSAAYNEAPKYKIFYNDKPYKTKIFDTMANVKASLMNAIGYNNKIIDLNQHFQDLSPEINDTAPEYWFQGEAMLYRSDMKNIEVYEWANRKKGNKVDFDAVKYYDELFDYVKVTAQFGSAVR